jgi:TetR/AcrR family transcriptional repressor of nem operon
MTKSTDTKQRLVDSARELIYSRSFGDVGVQAICEHAGVRKGSFYHFFKSKRELTLAALDDFLVAYKEQLLRLAFGNNTITPMARFQLLVELVYQDQLATWKQTGALAGCPFGNLAMELSTQDETIRARLVTIFELLRAPFEDNLRAAIEAGEIVDLDVTETARTMIAYMEGCMLMAKTQNDPALFRSLAARVTRLCFPPGD